ncbi:MAG: glycine-rich domain-containing protein-like [Nannocystaceae bacterium]
MEAARRSDTFPKDWPEERVRNAMERYRRFLLLAAKHQGEPIAPTRDIDEMWHLHMLSPRAYYEDCQRLMGCVLDHDGGFGKEEAEVPALVSTFERTAALWNQEYGEPYLDEGPSETDQVVKCWHNCQSRCWHACKSNVDQVASQ